LTIALTAAGCTGQSGEGRSPEVETPAAQRRQTPRTQSAHQPAKEKTMTAQMTSSAFDHDQRIPKKYTGEGQDVSPPLSWSGLPEQTGSIALVCDDPDAPTPQPWVHWAIYNIPADATGLPEGVPPDPELDNPAGARQGENSWDEGQTIGYRGPMPPPGHGTHHYHFRLYALDGPVELEPGATKEALREAMSGHILAEIVLTGTYSR
jgi:hypothetical protein